MHAKKTWYAQKAKSKPKLLGEQDSSDFAFNFEAKVKACLNQSLFQITCFFSLKVKLHYWGVVKEGRWGQLQINLSTHLQNHFTSPKEQGPV